MASTAELELLVKARDEASGVLGAVSKKAGGLANVAGKALRVGALAGGAAVAGLGIAAVKMGLDFEKSMAEVKTLLPDISEEGFGELRTSVLDLSKELGIATSDAVPALYQAISAGVPPDNVMDFMRVAGKAAIGGVTDLETAVDGITSVVNAYGDSALSAGATSDVMFTAVRLGKTNFEELSASLFNVIPTAASLGIGFEEVAAAMAVMTAQGVPTSVATTQLRQAFVEASKGGSELDKAIREMAGAGLAELVAQGGTATGIFEELRSSMPEQDFRDLFGSVEAMNAVMQLTGPNAEAMADALGETMSSAGASEEAFDTMAKTASFKLNKAINLLKVTLTEIGIKILPLLTKALDKALPFLEKNLPIAIEKAEKAIQDIRPHVEAFAKVFKTGVGVIMDVLEPLVKFIVNNKPVLIAAIAAIGIAILLAFGPVAIGIVAIIGFIALLGLLKDNIGAAKDFIVGKFEEIRDAVVGAVRAVIDWLEGNWPLILAILAGPLGLIVLAVITFKDDIIAFFTELKDTVFELVTDLKDKVVELWTTLKDKVVDIATGLKDTVVEVVTDFKDRLVRGFTNIWNKAVEIFEFLRTDVQTKIAETRDDVVAKILGIPAAIGNVAGLLTQKGKDLLIGLAKGYLAQWGSVFSWLSGLATRISNAVGSLASRLWFAGWQLISGLWNGIKARAIRIFEDLKQLANDIIGAITNPLGIFSPSKVMMEVGANLMKGLQKGVEGQALKVNAAVGNVTGGIAAGGGGALLSSGARAGGGGGLHLTLVIQSKFPPNPTDLASEVRAMLPEIERQLDLQRA
jgi:TP901 family phage tail tape measure protein